MAFLSFGLDSMVGDYYQTHQHELQTNYPGLSQARFLEETRRFLGPMNQGDFWGGKTKQKIEDFFSLVSKGTPLEYINHLAYFYQSEFFVDERVLIPRYETEILVELAKEEILNKGFHLIAEVGVGSGAIGLSLAQECNDHPMTFFMGDLSQKALEVAKINHGKLQYTFQN